MYKQRINNQKGYTLLTALYQLVILLIASHLIVLFIIIFYKYMNLEDDRDEMEWVLFTTDLNIYFERSHSVSVDKLKKTVTFTDPYTDKSIETGNPLEYVIQVRNNHVVRAVKSLKNFSLNSQIDDEDSIYTINGHEIVLPYISSASFTLNGNILTFEAVMKSGKVRKRDFVVTTYKK